MGLTVCGMCAVVASSTAVSDPVSARKLGRASIGLSVTGIIVTVLIIIIVVAVVLSAGASVASSCKYYIYGNCYKYKKVYSSYSYCSGYIYGSYCYYNWWKNVIIWANCSTRHSDRYRNVIILCVYATSTINCYVAWTFIYSGHFRYCNTAYNARLRTLLL